eukprot:gene3780-4359_t
MSIVKSTITVIGGGAAVSIKDDFFSEEMNICKKILNSWSVEGCRKWLAEEVRLDMALEKETNKYFPRSDSAREVRDLLVERCSRLGVEFEYDRRVDALKRQDDRWVIEGVAENDGAKEFVRESDVVILTMGGLSYPAVGTEGHGYRMAKTLGHKVEQTYPALTPLTGRHPGGQQGLPGVSLQVGLRSTGSKAARSKRSGFLFTHKGFSGPSTLDISHHYVKELESKRQPVDPLQLIASLGDLSKEEWAERLANAVTEHGAPNVRVVNRVAMFIPSRLADAVMLDAEIPTDRKVCELRTNERSRLIEALSACHLKITGHEGYRKAEVTGGGVSLKDINSQTLESRVTPSLYFAGEVLDCFGRIGGFNFFWAFVTGRMAGTNSINNLKV